jgi:WD40 repeat protein
MARLWDGATGRQLSVLAAHRGAITSVALGAFSGKTVLATASDDERGRLWWLDKVSPNDELGHIDRARVGVREKIALVSERWDFWARVWDRRCKQPSILNGRGPDQIVAIAFGPDGPVTGSRDGSVRSWRLVPGGAPRSVRLRGGHRGSIASLAVGPVGEQLAVLTGSEDRTAILQPTDGRGVIRVLAGHGGRVTSVALLRGFAVTGSDDRTARLWRSESGELMTVMGGHGGAVTSVALGAVQGQLIAATGSVDGIARLWALGEREASVEPFATVPARSDIRSVALDLNGNLALATSQGIVFLRLARP